MQKLFKWIGFVVVALLLSVSLAAGYVYVASERELSREFDARDDARLVISRDEATLAEGRRIAQLAGCMHCHGDDFSGRVVDDIPNLIRLVAPNVSVILPEYDDAGLATMLRKGVKPDGTSVFLMPSEMFRHLSDEDLSKLVSWLRTVPATTQGIQEKTQLRPIGRFLLAKGDFNVGARAIEVLPPAQKTFDPADPVSRGRYLVMNYCTECHGQNLEGFAPINAPALAVAKAYSLESFSRLLREGVPQGEPRELRIMGPTSQMRFSNFTAEEIESVHTYLSSL